jgi:DNA polymerase-3 subunit epsilon
MFVILVIMLAQRSFEELGTPLAAVTFCVVDLETTGGAADDSITEVGALKVKCGEVVGTFQTLVNPGRSVPAFIRILTGISDELLIDAPPIRSVLPSFLEFAGGSVLVAHNARFDTTFLNRALRACGYDRLGNTVLDTALLARKVLAGEVPNNKLETLARHLRCAHQPCHRAFEDVLATTDLLHHLIERVGGFGVTTLEDLCAFSSSRVDGTFEKIRMADGLPPAPGVYRFVGNGGKTLYVGKATDLRSRVRSYFYGDPRRRIRDLLRETSSITAEQHATTLEAEVAEARAIEREAPPYNRAGRGGERWYLKIALRPVPKLAPCRTPKRDGAMYAGPFKSKKSVALLLDALRDALPVHRCGRPERCGGCAFADLGRCDGPRGESAADAARAAVRALIGDADPVLDRLRARLDVLASQERYEEAAEVRDRGSLLERCVHAGADVWSLIDAGDIVLALDRRAVLIRDAQLAAATDVAEGEPVEAMLSRLRALARSEPLERWMTGRVMREARVITSWVRRTGDVRVLHASHGWAVAAWARPPGRFKAREGPRTTPGE